MSSVLAVFDGFVWHAMRDLELVMLWESLICYQQKHLWLIGHIRTPQWSWCTHTHAHTNTPRHALFKIGMHANDTLAFAV